MKRRYFYILFIFAGYYFPANAQTCNAFVGGYVPSWRDPATVDYTKLSHVFYAFASTNGNGDLLVDAPAVLEVFKTASAGKQRFLSISGGGDTSVPSMANSTTARQAFVNNCVTFCQANSLQGIDVDWEGIITAADSVNYGSLMRELAAALHSHSLQLTATVSYGSYGGDFYNVGALKEADWIQLMVYDQTGTWADSPFGNHSTYQHVLDAVSYWTSRGYTQLSNIVIGVPFYGYKFNSTQGGLATGMSYSEIVGIYPSISCGMDEIGLIEFNSPETIRKKVRYVIDHGLKGVMIWEMGQDLPSDNNKSLLKAISQAACDLPASCDVFVTTAVNESVPSDAIRFYPIPVQTSLTISADGPDHSNSVIELVNNLGQRLTRKETSFPEGMECLSMADIAPGIYYVRVLQESQRSVVKRIIKIQ